MKTINFNIYLIPGMSGELFSERIMVDKPFETIQTRIIFDDGKCGIRKTSDLVAYIKEKQKSLCEKIGPYGMENFSYQNIYLEYKDCLLGLEDDKELYEIFEYFNVDHLTFSYLYVAGGASIHCNGYRFEVRSREQNHLYLPHVHVVKAGVAVRYFIKDFKRFEQDEYSREHARDEKKKILPALKKNQDKLMEYWNLVMAGYFPPAIDEDGKQYYKES